MELTSSLNETSKASLSTSDQENKRVMRQFLLLPLVLGSLLIITGVVGLYILHRSGEKLNKLNESALGPTLAFKEINDQLNTLSKNLLRLNGVGIEQDNQEKAIKKVKSTLSKIDKHVLHQVDLSKGVAYENYLKQWFAKWQAFYKDVAPQVEEVDQLKENITKIDGDITNLIEDMSNVSSFIDADVKDMLEESTRFSRNATIGLLLTLGLGLLIGVASSVVILGTIRKLFIQIATGKRNIEALLNNLDQGFFTFDKTGKVLDGVSKAAKQFLGVDPTGKSFEKSLPLDEKKEANAKGWLEMIYGDTLTFQDFKPLAPGSFEKDDKYYELDFRPIYQEGTKEKLEKVICIASDKTEERKLRQKAEEETALVKLVMIVLSDRGSFVDYVLETRKSLQEIKNELKKEHPSVDVLFRGMHSLKGGAAAFNMNKVAREAHSFENELQELRVEGEEKLKEYIPVLEKGSLAIEKYFEEFLKQHEPVLGKISDDEDRTKVISVPTIFELCQMIFHHIGKESPIFKNFVEKLVQEDFASAFVRFESVVKGVAERQLKKVNFNIEQNKIRVFMDPYAPLLSSFIHVFRNAVDHGIEDEIEREEKGKNATGTIDVKFFKENDRFKIIVEDDGRGIDTKLVKKKALEKKLITQEEMEKMSEEEAMQLLFKNGFSTKEEVTDLSGRGVGLDAVKYEAIKLGGNAYLKSVLGKGTQLIVEVPLIEAPFLVNTIQNSGTLKSAA